MGGPWKNKKLLVLLLATGSVALLYFFVDLNLFLPHSSIVVPEPQIPTVVTVTAPVTPTTSSPKPDQTVEPNTAESLPRILLVSAYFPLSKSKHSASAYSHWLDNFLSKITTDLYFFTTPEMESEIRRARGSLPIILNTSFSSPFDIPFTGQSPAERKQMYTKMHSKDRERKIHTPSLYAIWNSKPYMLDEAMTNSQLLGKHYDYGFWNDAGSFRHKHAFTTWPDPGRVAEVWKNGTEMSKKKSDDLLFFPMFYTPHSTLKFWSEGMGPIDNEFSEGSFFGGRKPGISWYRRAFYAYHRHYNSHRQNNMFVGKDQTLINALLVLFSERFITVWGKDPRPPFSFIDSNAAKSVLPSEIPLGSCGTEFYYYQYFLGAPSVRAAMVDIYKHEMSIWRNWPWEWSPTEWFKERTDCKITGTRWMLDVLKGAFSKGWNPPGRSVNI